MQPSHTMHSYATLVMCDRLHCQYTYYSLHPVTGVEIEANISTPGLLMMFKTQPAGPSSSITLQIHFCSTKHRRLLQCLYLESDELSHPLREAHFFSNPNQCFVVGIPGGATWF